MTIRKGQEWGEAVALPVDLRRAASDAELAAIVVEDPSVVAGLSGGDLHRSLGSPPSRTDMQRLPIDLIQIRADEKSFVAVAHLVIRRRWWRGRIVGAMNVDHLGPWNVAPRAHPNDGRFDVIEVDPSMTFRERLQARRRLPMGSHVPHPKITVRTAKTAEWKFETPHGVWVDGVHVVDARSVSAVIAPDAFAVVV